VVFSSPIFLFGFLPIALLAYYLSPRIIKNITLLVFSLMFYAWGEVFYLMVMIVSIISNYFIGRLIYKHHEIPYCQKLWITIGIIINLTLLFSFKYANFITDNVNIALSQINFSPIDLHPVHLPLGISFFTFQAISYIVDVYRKEVPKVDWVVKTITLSFLDALPREGWLPVG
jgi:Predicted membrane protein involved in D-alanine export